MINIAAVILILSGLIIRIGAIMQLRHDFSLYPQKPTMLHTKGIYAIIRHPAYLGTYMILAGLSILCIEFAFMYFVLWFFYVRAKQEESIMKVFFKDHDKYCEKTRMFVPKLKRKQNG